jgi:hypothetical protein
VVKTFSKFNDRTKAIELCTNRFDEETKNAFRELYVKLEQPPEAVVTEQPKTIVDLDPEIPF